MADIEIHSVVALLEDLPGEGLVRGQVGTVVESWAPGVYEVEFSDESGRAYAMVALKADQLMRLYHAIRPPDHELELGSTKTIGATFFRRAWSDAQVELPSGVTTSVSICPDHMPRHPDDPGGLQAFSFGDGCEP